jgi:hypothetical protein
MGRTTESAEEKIKRAYLTLDPNKKYTDIQIARIAGVSRNSMGRYKNEVKRQLASAQPGGAVATPEVEVKVEESPAAPRRSLKDRLLGVVKPTPEKSATPKRKPVPKRGQENLLVKLLPPLFATLIAAWAKDKFPDPYKPCAPSKQEVGDMLGPLWNIIGRRVEVYAEVSQDAIDLTNALICAIAYATRAYVTYVQIKQEEKLFEPIRKASSEIEKQPAREYAAGVPEPSLSNGLRAYQSASNGTGGNPAGEHEPGPGSESYYGNGTDLVDGSPELRNWEAQQISELFRRDKQGRVGLGLLPG